MESLKILMSAYSCEPGKGSEPGVGWRWALETARLGHEVWVMTREFNRANIEAGLGRSDPALQRMHFVYYDLPPQLCTWKRGERGVHLYYALWQWGAYRAARPLHAAQRFDAVQHITFGVMRQASFMGRLGIPLIVGPVGGGESAPFALRQHFPFAGYFRDALRDFANLAVRFFDPFVRQMLAQAVLILVKTPETAAWLPEVYRHKSRTMLEIGIDPLPCCVPAAAAAARSSSELRLLYVGRFMYMKGMELGLAAVAALRARGVDVTLTLIGRGAEGERWRQLADALGLADRVQWVPWMEQSELLQAYATYDALLFPSLHDSSGNVVLEAMAGGLPVVCLKLGGPPQMVDASCGRVVEVEMRNEAQVIAGLADALGELAGDPALLARLRAGALARAGQSGWRQVIARVWDEQGMGYRAVVSAGGADMAFGHA